MENNDEDDELQEIDGEGNEWLPSMNLYALIQCIPEFISEVLAAQKAQDSNEVAPMIGKFYLGLQYDYQQIWMQN